MVDASPGLQLDLESIRGNIADMGAAALPIEEMTTAEKLTAMESLWDSLCRDEAQIPVQEWHKQILDERRRLIDIGEAKFIDWETAKANIRKRIS